MDYNKLLAPIAVVWIAVCLYICTVGRKRKGDPKFERIPIILGLSVAGLVGVMTILGMIFGIK